MLVKSRTVCYELTDSLTVRAYYEDDAQSVTEVSLPMSDRETAEFILKRLAFNIVPPCQLCDVCNDFNLI